MGVKISFDVQRTYCLLLLALFRGGQSEVPQIPTRVSSSNRPPRQVNSKLLCQWLQLSDETHRLFLSSYSYFLHACALVSLPPSSV